MVMNTAETMTECGGRQGQRTLGAAVLGLMLTGTGDTSGEEEVQVQTHAIKPTGVPMPFLSQRQQQPETLSFFLLKDLTWNCTSLSTAMDSLSFTPGPIND